MKIYKLILTMLILPIILAGCANSNNNSQNNIEQQNSSTEITPIIPANPIEKPNVSIPQEELKPAIPQIKYDSLIKFNKDTNIYSKKGKYIATIQKNKYLPIISSDKNGYYTTFNYNDIYINKSNNITIVKVEKSNDKVEKMIDVAKTALGTKYVYGAERYHFNGKKNSNFNKYYFDCSSLTQYAFYVSNGIIIDTTSRGQAVQGKLIKKSQISRGDLLFFTNSSRKNNTGINRIGHVAIYLGDNKILHTSSNYAVIEEISSTRWSYYISARRYI